MAGRGVPTFLRGRGERRAIPGSRCAHFFAIPAGLFYPSSSLGSDTSCYFLLSFFYFLAASGRDGWIPSRPFPAWGMYSAEHFKQLDEIKGLLLMNVFIRVNGSVHEKVCYP